MPTNGYTSTTLTFEFDSSSDLSGSLAWEIDTERESPAINQQYLRLYPDVDCKYFASVGILRYIGKSSSDVEESLTLLNSTEVQLTKVPDGSVSLEVLGSLYGSDGGYTSARLTYDEASNSIKASAPCYGVLKVKYKAKYRLFMYTFHGPGCAVNSEEPYTPGIVVAFRTDQGAVADLELTPPYCGNFWGGRLGSNLAEVSKISVEIHKDYPPRLMSVTNRLYLYVPGVPLAVEASCRVRVTPGDGLEHIGCAPGTLTLVADDSGLPTYEEEIVEETVTFSNAISINLSYQPESVISYQALSDFYDAHGNRVDVDFLSKGDTVTEADWVTSRSYTNAITRSVKNDELVAASGSVAKPVTGSAYVKYRISSRVYELVFEPTHNSAGMLNGWKTSYVFSYDGNETGLLIVTPPTLVES